MLDISHCTRVNTFFFNKKKCRQKYERKMPYPSLYQMRMDSKVKIQNLASRDTKECTAPYPRMYKGGRAEGQTQNLSPPDTAGRHPCHQQKRKRKTSSPSPHRERLDSQVKIQNLSPIDTEESLSYPKTHPNAHTKHTISPVVQKEAGLEGQDSKSLST